MRSLSLDSLQIKEVMAGPFAFFQPLRAASDHDPLDFFNAKSFDGDELTYSLKILAVYANASVYYAKRRSIPL